MQKLATVLSLIVALLLAVAPLASAQNMPDLAGTHWTLATIAGQPALDGSSVTINFDTTNGVGGSDGCNLFGGNYRFDGETLVLDEIISTQMACVGPVDNQARAFWAALAENSAVVIVNGRLVITYGEGLELVFVPSPTLEGGDWTLISIDGGAPVPGTTVTITFDGEGAFGLAGCNRYSATYTREGDTLAFGPIASTMMACADPVQQQELAFFAALESGAVYSIANGQLTLVTASGTTLVFAPTLSQLGATWKLIAQGGTPALDSAAVTITFNPDGTAFGSAGCNSFSTSYVVAGDSLSFGLAITTLMACPPDIMDQESAFLAALNSAAAFRLGDGQLTIVYGDGDELVFEALPVVTVSVTYLVRMALPDTAEITVTIEDISRADAPADVLVSQTIVSGGANVPFTFELPYDPAQLDDSAMYSVRAQIRVDGALWFTSDTVAPVLTGGAGTDVELVLVPAR